MRQLSLLLGLGLALQWPATALGAATVLPAARLTDFCGSDAGDFKDGFCTGFILGVAYSLDGKPGSGVCMPAITVKAVRDKVAGYLMAHARTSQQDASVALALAVKASFPCRK